MPLTILISVGFQLAPKAKKFKTYMFSPRVCKIFGLVFKGPKVQLTCFLEILFLHVKLLRSCIDILNISLYTTPRYVC